MSKHTLSHASQILAGDGVAFNLALMGDELDNTMRGIRIGVLVTEFFNGGGTDADSVATSQTPAAGGQQDLTLDGVNVTDGVATLDYCGQVQITAAANETARTFTILGKDANGRPQAEEVAGPNATTGVSAKHFTTIDRIFVDDDTAGAVEVGQNEAGPRGLRRKAIAWPSGDRAVTYLAVEASTIEITGTFDGGHSATPTATNADQRADYIPIALTDDIEVTYLADLTKEGIGANYTDSSQAVPSAI